MRTTLLIFFTAFLATGCGKDVTLGDLGLPNSGGSNPATPDSVTASCGADRMMHWQFVQPQPTTDRSVDLLFVVDTSSSLGQERAKIAEMTASFVNALHPATDYRIGVMLAHGGASSYSGRLYAGPGQPKVLNSQNHSASYIQSSLKTILSTPVADTDEADGEMMFYSFHKSLSSSSRLAEARALGFFRTGVALSVIFISDENDVCFRPELNGFTLFPDYVPSQRNVEVTAFGKYCSQITIDSVLAEARRIQKEMPLSFAAVAHIDRSKVVRTSEDAIGHGLIELVKKSLNGVLLDISDQDYSAGLAQLGNIVRTSLELQTVFKLTKAPQLVPGSLQVRVDGKTVAANYESTATTVHLSAAEAGSAGSLVNVSACRAN